MKDQISKRDWETISAYIDGQLSTRKKSRFDVRLSQEPHLQQALEELQRTRQILRNTPSLRAPQNFMLTPQMAGQQQRLPRLSPIFGWASAVASFLLVLVLVGDIFSVGGAIPVAVSPISQPVDRTAPSDFGMAQESADDEPVALKGEAAGGYSQGNGEEFTEGLEQPEVASAPEEDVAVAAAEPAAIEEAEPEPTKVVEMIVSGETADDVIETPDESLVVPAIEGTSATWLSPSETTEIRELEVQPETGADTSIIEEGVVAVFALTTTATLTPESTNGQAIDVLPLEVTTQPPAEKAMPLAPQAQPSVTTSDQALMPGERAVDTAEEAVPIEEESDDFLLGAEVILALIALGLGIAWLYMRRQGG